MNPILFYFFAILMLGFGISVVANRNPVASALSLVVSFFCLAALYVDDWLLRDWLGLVLLQTSGRNERNLFHQP